MTKNNNQTKISSCALVIFGASGDLTKRKLIPALYALEYEKQLPEKFAIVGMARRDVAFLDNMKQSIIQFSRYPFDETLWQKFSARLSYVAGDFSDKAAYRTLAEHLKMLDDGLQLQKNLVFYIATPADFFAPILQHLSENNLISKTTPSFNRVVIEKPFGKDLQSAEELNRVCLSLLREDQIFRIDHYLGKETVQNILAFRFANRLFDPIWNKEHIDHIEITAAESIGIEGRGGFYDQTGTLRDMVQNHLLQVLAQVTMEPPIEFSAEAIHREKINVLNSLRPGAVHVNDWVVRAQYTENKSANIVGYLQEPDVKPDSSTETYVALHVQIDNARFKGVPIYLRAGKHLPKRLTEVVIALKPSAMPLTAETNKIILRIQPNEGIDVEIFCKKPGLDFKLERVTLPFTYKTSFAADLNTGRSFALPEAYERLLHDALVGDSTLFAHGDEVLIAWKFCDPVLRAFQESPKKLATYQAMTWGPTEADDMLARQGHRWVVS